MATVKKYKSTGNNEYTEDALGKCVGVEWTDSFGNILKCIFTAFESLNPTIERSVTVFHTFIKPVGLTDWIWKEGFSKTVDNTEFRYVTQDANFGKLEQNPYDITPATDTEPEVKTLKAGLIPNVDFLYDAVFVGQFGVFPLNAILVQTILEHYGLELAN